MEDLRTNFEKILQELPDSVSLVAVSKTYPAEIVQQVYDLGQRAFGENRVQELLEKRKNLPEDTKWHLIGHLQTNKVKDIAGFIDTIESVDSERLLREIEKHAEQHKRKIKVLLQIKIAEEESKYGLKKEEAAQIFRAYVEGKFPHVEIKGLMGMATFTEDEDMIRKEFTYLKNTFEEFSRMKPLSTLSMGMSGDFRLAVKCGSNSVRIGSAIFGVR